MGSDVEPFCLPLPEDTFWGGDTELRRYVIAAESEGDEIAGPEEVRLTPTVEFDTVLMQGATQVAEGAENRLVVDPRQPG